MSTPSWLKALDPTSSTSALGGYVKQGISAIPLVGGLTASTLTQVGAANKAAADQKRAEEAAAAGAFGMFSPSRAGLPGWLLAAGAAALVVVVLLLRRK